MNPATAATFDELDDTVVDLAGWHRHDLAHAFEFLGAVVEARFAVIGAGLAMTREAIRNG